MRLHYRIGFGVLSVLGLAGCSPLRLFDAVMPQDRGGLRVATDLAYGTDARQALDVYAPRRTATGALPVVVFLYGGSWSSGMRADYGFVGRALAARGFVVVIPDYRLVPIVRFPAFLRDCAAAVRWTRANAARFGGDGARIVLAGHSAGAYNAAMLALDPQWLGSTRAAVRGFVGIAGPYDFLPLDGPVVAAAFGDWPVPAQTHPITFATAGAPEALLVTGADDTTVDPRNTRALATRLTTAGVPATVRAYPKLGHVGALTALARPFRGKAPVLDDVAAFAARVTAPDYSSTPAR